MLVNENENERRGFRGWELLFPFFSANERTWIAERTIASSPPPAVGTPTQCAFLSFCCFVPLSFCQ
jgi:hypothetical protein